ncbi:hypothetical protein GCM10010121_002750 [Streptomyces brasiliensis]|uniref:Uncharacterized protein n=1 Tax=Streptomyces brasiliensis TaxID=1954 RepID=A0A917NEN9_9ACTN|nr:hypothetical protein GCM10010121_002750 [Streptomyces brasiliensis]
MVFDAAAVARAAFDWEASHAGYPWARGAGRDWLDRLARALDPVPAPAAA